MAECEMCLIYFKERFGKANRFCSHNCYWIWKKGKPLFYLRNKVEKICMICGKPFKVIKSLDKKYVCCSKECSSERKRLMALGKNNINWKGGHHPKNRVLRGTKKYKEWRLMVFGRDDYTCQMCGKRGCYLEAHHKKSFAEYINLRFDVDNGITLCEGCHITIDEHKRRFV